MSQVSYGTITISDLTDIDSVVNYYLATDLSSGVTKNNPASGHGTWTTNIQNATLSSTFQYLWNYEKILGAGNIEINSTDPIIIGHFGINGTNGTNGVDGNSITSIDEYYQATNSTSKPGSSGWSKNTLVVPTSTNKYLWNYQVIHYSKTADEGSYNDARIIGVYGDTGERGTSILKVTTTPTATSGTISGFSYSYRMSLSTVKTQSGKNEVLVGDIIEYGSNHYQVGYVSSSYVYLGPVTSIKGADGIQYYTHIYYSSKQTPTSASDVSSSPSGKTFVGIQTTTSSTAPAWNDSNWNWTKYIGTDATQYYAFVKYATDANGTNMQDTPASGYDYVGTYTGTKANPTASDFNWSKYTGEPGTPATQYYAFIKYATNSAGANMTDTPTSNTTYVGTYSGTKSNPTASDYKWSEYVGADGVSVTAVKEIYYLTTGNAPTAPAAGVNTTSTSTSANIWTTVVPTYVPNGKYYTSIQTTLSKGTSPISSVAVLNNALTSANSNAANALSQATDAQERVSAAEANIIALQSRLKKIWTNLSDSETYPAGTYAASGIGNANVVENDSSTYGYNTFLNHNKLALRYNDIDMTTLTTGALTFYKPTQQNGEWIQGIVGLEINSDGLNLYGSLTSEPDAFLDINGLNLLRGGIVAGVTNTKDFVYLSSNNFAQEIEPFYRLTLDEAIIPNKNYYEYDEENDIYNEVNSPTVDDINLYYEYMTPLPGTIAIDNFNKTDWKQIIGTNFAVDLEGNLYALNANINGIINATSGIIGGFTIGNNELYSNNKTDVKSTGKGTYIGPLGFNISDGSSENTTFFTSDEVSIGGVLNWKAGEDNNPGNLSIKADEIIIGIDYMPTNDTQPIEGKIYYYLSGEEYIEFQGNTFDSNVEYYEPIDFMVKSLLQDSIKVNNNQTIKIDELEDMVNNIRNITNSYKEFITTVINGNNSYIDFQYQNETYNPKLKITTNSISFSLDEDENIVTQITKINNDSLMHTTFGEFENLRMRAGGRGNLTWIARDNGHLSLKVVE